MQAKKHRKHRRKTPDESKDTTDSPVKQQPAPQEDSPTKSPPMRQSSPQQFQPQREGNDELTMEEMMELANDNFSDRALQIVRAANRHFVSQLATSIHNFVANVEAERKKAEQASPFNITASLGNLGLGDDTSPSEPDDFLTKGLAGFSSGNDSVQDDTTLNDSKERPMISLGRTSSRTPSPSPKATAKNQQVLDISGDEEEETMMFEPDSQANSPTPEAKKKKKRKSSQARSDKSSPTSSPRTRKKKVDAFTFSSDEEIESL